MAIWLVRAGSHGEYEHKLDKHRLGEPIDLIGTLSLVRASADPSSAAGGEEVAQAELPMDAVGMDTSATARGPLETPPLPSHRSVDLLGRVYEPSAARQTVRSTARRVNAANQYFLTRFASAEGKNGGQPSEARQIAEGSPQGERPVHQFYTPSSVVRLLVEMLAPYKGRVYDPACGSGGIFVQPESRSEAETASRRLPAGRAKRGNFVETHGGKLGDIAIYGQKSNGTTRRLAVMNLAIRGIEAKVRVYKKLETYKEDAN